MLIAGREKFRKAMIERYGKSFSASDDELDFQVGHYFCMAARQIFLKRLPDSLVADARAMIDAVHSDPKLRKTLLVNGVDRERARAKILSRAGDRIAVAVKAVLTVPKVARFIGVCSCYTLEYCSLQASEVRAKLRVAVLEGHPRVVKSLQLRRKHNSEAEARMKLLTKQPATLTTSECVRIFESML